MATTTYRTGTITLTNGSAVVTGTDTAWLTAELEAEMFLAAVTDPPVDLALQLQSIDGDEQLTMTAPWTGATLTDVTYQISRDVTSLKIPVVNRGDLNPWSIISAALRVINNLIAGKQGLSSTLTVLAALTTTAFGRARLTDANAAAARAALELFYSSLAQSGARISMRDKLGNQIEFGHSNQAGYGGNIGCYSGNGSPFLIFFGEEGTSINTVRSRGYRSIIISGSRENSSGIVFSTVADAAADNQVPTTIATLSRSGNFSITGALSKASGTFLIDHPLDPANRDLRHGFVESPRYDLIYRGVAHLVDGVATVDIDADSNMSPGTFAALTKNAVVTSLQNQTGFARVRPVNLSGGTFEIHCEDTESTDAIAWVVIAERNDAYVREMDPNCVDGEFVPEVEKEEFVDGPKEEIAV